MINWPSITRVATDRCVLQPLSRAYVEEMVGVLADSSLYEYIGGNPPSLGELQSRYARQALGHSPDGSQWWCNWIITRAEDNRAFGHVQATVQKSDQVLEAEIAWVIHPAMQGKGFATESAASMIQWLQNHEVRRFVAHIHPQHSASASVAERLGLETTGRQKDGEDRWILEI